MFKKIAVLVCLLYFCCVNIASCQEYNVQTYVNLLKANASFQNVYLSHLADYVYYIDLILNDNHPNLAFKCKSDLEHLKNGLLKKEEFALNFYEANAKDSPGILTGSDGNLGNFQQCLAIRTATNYGLDYSGKYCLISVQTPLADTIKNGELYKRNQDGLSKEGKFHVDFNLGSIYGVCIPNSCNIKQLLTSINNVTNKYSINIVGQDDDHCSSNQPKPYTVLEIICSIITLSFIALCIFSCYSDNEFLRIFSIKKNLKRIYSVPIDYESNEFNFIHGFKAIYALLSAGVHACAVLYVFAPFLYGSAKYQISDLDALTKGMIKRLLIGPDIAFFIGGFLAIVAWHMVFHEKRGSLFLYISSRFLRTIPIIISMLLLDRIWPRFGAGPFHNQLTHHLEMNCQRSFWKLFLFISNQDRAVDICQLPSWFISVDFQLYILHYFLIKYLVQKPKLGIVFAFVQMVCMIIYSTQDILLNNLEPYFNVYNVFFYNSFRFERQYFVSLIHSNSYTLGVLAGWLVINRKKFQIFETPINRYFAFFLSGLSVSLAVYLPDLFFGDDNTLPNDNLPYAILLAFWGSIFRQLYVLFFLATFYFMSIGYFKFGKTILSHRFFLVFSRMSYTIIMSQFIYLWYNIGTKKQIFSLTMLDVFKEATFSLIISVVIGNLVFTFLECPIANLLSFLTGLDKKKTQLKKDCSSAKLNSEMQAELQKEIEIREKELFSKPKINVILYDENSNSLSVKPKFNI